MPSYGEKQKPAGVKLECGCKSMGPRSMESRDKTISTALKLEPVQYKGNAVLNANR